MLAPPGASVPERLPPVVWDPSYEVDIGAHVFVTAKYRLTRERLLEQRTLTEEHFLAPVPATDEQLALVHTTEYLSKVRSGAFSLAEILRLEVPFSEAGRDAMTLMCGGTLLTARLALAHGTAGHLGGGFHHAFAGHGEGFCLLNDVAVAARALTREGVVERVTVLDLDVHHGNGTAAIFEDDPAVSTFSMHQENNYPALKPPSDLDLGLADGTGDEEYLGLLTEHLPSVLDGHAPELVIYLAGADPYREDQLGGLGLTLDGLRMRDRLVLESARDRGIAVAVVLAGGYAHSPEDTVRIHAATVEELVRVTGLTPAPPER
ncbi:MAG TPA: histone deacetylase [Longimicrobiales bacterium]|nr:histone deacetylase [Longimicrobiales bacterium]